MSKIKKNFIIIIPVLLYVTIVISYYYFNIIVLIYGQIGISIINDPFLNPLINIVHTISISTPILYGHIVLIIAYYLFKYLYIKVTKGRINKKIDSLIPILILTDIINIGLSIYGENSYTFQHIGNIPLISQGIPTSLLSRMLIIEGIITIFITIPIIFVIFKSILRYIFEIRKAHIKSNSLKISIFISLFLILLPLLIALSIAISNRIYREKDLEHYADLNYIALEIGRYHKQYGFPILDYLEQTHFKISHGDLNPSNYTLEPSSTGFNLCTDFKRNLVHLTDEEKNHLTAILKTDYSVEKGPGETCISYFYNEIDSKLTQPGSI